MINQKKRAYHFETSSLLALKLVLIEAEKASPPHVRKEQKDMNEELALKLIASMKKGIVIARRMKSDEAIPNTLKRHLHLAQEQVLLCREECPPHNDIKIEP